MESVYRLVDVDGASKSPTFVVDASAPSPLDGATPIPPHALVVRVARSNLEGVVDEALRRRIRARNDDDAPPRKFPLGNCVAGTVVAVGEGCEEFQVGDSVIGLVPPDSRMSDSRFRPGGLSRFCLLRDHAVARVATDAAAAPFVVAALPRLVKAYTALHYQARLCAGESLLVAGAASPSGLVFVQLASLWGAKVLALCDSSQESRRLENLRGGRAAVVVVVVDSRHARRGEEGVHVLERVMEETSGIGVDCVVDLVNGKDCGNDVSGDGVDRPAGGPSSFPKRVVIDCLGAGGRWITLDARLQLDPPDSEALFLKGASISFLFDHWLLSSAQVGRFRHILLDALELIERGAVRLDARTVRSWAGVDEALRARVADDDALVFDLEALE